jgi:hypothetical protein
MARNRYEQLIERIFLAHYERGSTEVTFEREEIPAMAKRLGIEISEKSWRPNLQLSVPRRTTKFDH